RRLFRGDRRDDAGRAALSFSSRRRDSNRCAVGVLAPRRVPDCRRCWSLDRRRAGPRGAGRRDRIADRVRRCDGDLRAANASWSSGDPGRTGPVRAARQSLRWLVSRQLRSGLLADDRALASWWGGSLRSPWIRLLRRHGDRRAARPARRLCRRRRGDHDRARVAARPACCRGGTRERRRGGVTRAIVSMHLLAASGAFAPVDQHYLLQARQMQALSFAVHIPLVAFAISFPALVLFVEWLGRRRADELYLTLARRWSKVMLALFAIGVITGTTLSFEMGLLWPNFTGTFGGVFGLGFAIEGFSFFLEAIFIGIYVYGWRRLSPRAHLLAGVPIVITGFTGSLMVIAVNAWMNHPGGFALRNGKVVDVHPLSALFGNSYLWHELIHMYIAGYIVSGFVVAGCYAFGRLRGRWGRYERTALAIPLTVAALAAPVQILVGDWAARDVATTQPMK